MAIDPRIALGVQPFQLPAPPKDERLNMLAQVMQLRDAESAHKLNSLKIQEAERGVSETNALNEAYRTALSPDGSVDRTRLYGDLATRGLGSRIPDIQKKFYDADKAKFDVQKAAFEGYKNFQLTLGSHATNPNLTKQEVLGSVAALVQSGSFDDQTAQKLVANLPDDPQQLRVALQQILKSQMTPEQMLTVFAPKPTQVDNGQQIGFLDTNPNSPTYGQATAGAPVQKVMTPGEVASDKRGWAQLNEQRRHHGVTEGNAAQTLKLQQDKERREAGQDAGSGGPVLGVPAPTVLPWSNQSNPKDANKVKAQEIARGAKEIEKDVDAARKEAGVAQAAARFMELNQKIPTGGLVDKMALTRWAQSMGTEYAELEAITARLVPGMREPGAGASSDLDVRMFERATVGVDKPKRANENIAKGLIARAQQAQDYADFRQTYLEQNGTLQGADRHWKEYVNANPIFDPGKPGAFELNTKRKGWTEHFKGQTSKAAPSAPSSGGSKPRVVDFGSLR